MRRLALPYGRYTEQRAANAANHQQPPKHSCPSGEPLSATPRAIRPSTRATVAVVLLALVLILPPSRELFHFGPLHADDLTLVLSVVAVFATLEFLIGRWRRCKSQDVSACARRDAVGRATSPTLF
jgi:hypothetical protein